ncbi:mutator protein, Nudix hydrolase, MutT family [Cytophaga hutchinsonii ATCC 33406]|uniref:Mutator protein, Nudix hydrolase, MutT family n=2 Tax=Cytophaga hutchinsonii TaxID=985 RepID=A0A6N4SSL4_CYTH3|nr:mutator protein, Nudix hydrolase, MutT family [Cytophaga hutchinsonii ATCC 33406]SFX93035.1 NUDIX domain-containing protein [Cytophaga hutchinsonii ATCC 33406]
MVKLFEMKRKSKILFVQKITSQEYRVLLGRRVSNNESFWWIPGGSVEPGETDFEAGIRELDEELFLTAAYSSAIHAYELKNEVPPFIEYESAQAKNIIFMISMIQANDIPLPAIKDEFEELAWFNIDALPANMSKEFAYIQHQLGASVREL